MAAGSEWEPSKSKCFRRKKAETATSLEARPEVACIALARFRCWRNTLPLPEGQSRVCQEGWGLGAASQRPATTATWAVAKVKLLTWQSAMARAHPQRLLGQGVCGVGMVILKSSRDDFNVQSRLRTLGLIQPWRTPERPREEKTSRLDPGGLAVS